MQHTKVLEKVFRYFGIFEYLDTLFRIYLLRKVPRTAQTSRKVLIICIINKKINQCAVKKTDIIPETIETFYYVFLNLFNNIISTEFSLILKKMGLFSFFCCFFNEKKIFFKR